MRRLIASLPLFGLLWFAPAAVAGEGKVLKVFPQYLDQLGRHTLAPSLFARDAYQAFLRKRPEKRGGFRVAVQWKGHASDASGLRLRLEMRSLRGEELRTTTLEKPALKGGFFSHWTEFRLTGSDYKDFGELAAWRVSLWDGEKELAQQESFLWSGVDKTR